MLERIMNLKTSIPAVAGAILAVLNTAGVTGIDKDTLIMILGGLVAVIGLFAKDK